MRLFYYFNFESNYDVLKLKSPCILLNTNIHLHFITNETESKRENLTYILQKRTNDASAHIKIANQK